MQRALEGDALLTDQSGGSPSGATRRPRAHDLPAPDLEGSIERITFSSEDGSFTVARLKTHATRQTVTVVGLMPGIVVGSRIKLWGEWQAHARFGRQFVVHAHQEELPTTVDGIRRYLSSGLVKGIGPVTARRIVDHFGEATLETLDRNPERLSQVPNVGTVRTKRIAEAWQEQKRVRDLMLFLQSHHIPSGLAARIYRHYGDAATRILRENPYRLANDIHGIGFLTADRVARSLGVAADSPHRSEAGLEFTLTQLAGRGHVYAPREELLGEAAQLLAVDEAELESAVDRLASCSRIVLDRSTADSGDVRTGSQAVYLPGLHRAEVTAARRLRLILDHPSSRLQAFRDVDWDKSLEWLDAMLPYSMAENQRQAVVTALSRKICVLTGGPGTGKTTALRAVLSLLQSKGLTAALAAPTGRAAKRMEEATGVAAKTIHRLLEVKPAEGFSFGRNEDNPLEADLVIIDEASMIDCPLMAALSRAIHPESHLLLVGDADQLPSVGPGNVLRDLIASNSIPVVRLRHIFRQAGRSLIVTNAHRINQGQMPIFSRGDGDFFLFHTENQEEAAERIIDVVATRIPRRFGYDALDGVQVLSPMHRGAAGVRELNARLQQRLNPRHRDKPEIKSGDRVYRRGDKVMQVRNNYSRGVFNGDLGRIAKVDGEERKLLVRFEATDSTYDFDELDELVLAYACTIHKSQGAEYPAVVLALLPSHYVMLQRNLLYTGVTRARELCVVVGSRRAIGRAVTNDRVAARHTLLAGRLAAGRAAQ